ncbi:MAG: methylamine utilization protein [Ectothiorhodospiraceae bacterium]|nr:methylamine utilization protein [Ectothiorhodospiraceae bacterium]
MRQMIALLGALLGVMLISPGALAGGEVRVTVQGADGAGVEHAAIVLRGPEDAWEPPSDNEATIDQIDREFVPPAISIPVNTRVLFPNQDDIRHHVYSFSSAKSFELPLYKGMPARPIRFPQPGIVTIGCNIHDWMIAHIYVVDAAIHGLTDAEGVWAAADVPAGRYRVEVWHHGLDEERQTTGEIRVEPGTEVDLEVSVEVASRPAPRRRGTVPGYR